MFPTNTQSYNRFSYVNNNPLSLVDPTGFDDKNCGDEGCSGGVSAWDMAGAMGQLDSQVNAQLEADAAQIASETSAALNPLQVIVSGTRQIINTVINWGTYIADAAGSAGVWLASHGRGLVKGSTGALKGIGKAGDIATLANAATAPDPQTAANVLVGDLAGKAAGTIVGLGTASLPPPLDGFAPYTGSALSTYLDTSGVDEWIGNNAGPVILPMAPPSLPPPVACANPLFCIGP